MNEKKYTEASPRRRRGLSYRRRKSLYGYAFIGLWLVGTLFFFILPLAESLRYSFSEITVEPNRLNISFVGIKNYISAMKSDQYYIGYLEKTLKETLWKTPLIIIFSLFIAVILNQKFKGRALARTIFFLPVIIVTGPVFKIISGDMDISGTRGAEQFSTMFSVDLVGGFAEFLGIYGEDSRFMEFVASIADNIFGIVWSSGVQIILFLGALQHIPPSAREAAEIEGATAWEYFWKITFPYVSPFIMANLIYTVIDSFTSPMNMVMRRILTLQNEELNYGAASAMAWIYFIIVMAIIGIIALTVNKFVFYENEE